MPPIRRAILSVSDKSGIVEFARELHGLGVEILSTGGTARHLKDNKIPVIEVSDYTGQPEILDGRLKTLHPKIHGGILAIRSNKKHQQELKESEIGTIDMVVVNLYPFEETIALTRPACGGPPSPAKGRGQEGVSLKEAIEQIDIGGPTMLRAAAKNWEDVTVVCDPADYPEILKEMKNRKGEISSETNFRLAKKVFAHTARYDGVITNYLTGEREGKLPEIFNLQAQKVQDLRYGENPHQKGAFYSLGSTPLPRQLHGRELSFNNILDLDAAIGLVAEFEEQVCVIIKHTNPCGVALTPGPSPPPHYRRTGAEGRGLFIAARSCDSLSAFGGIIGFNREVDEETAREIAKDFYECVVAPGFDSRALEILKGKKNIRLMELRGSTGDMGLDLKRVGGGLLVQERDLLTEKIRNGKVVTKRQLSEAEWQALEFAWKIAAHVKSNAIVVAGEVGDCLCTLGVGAGQMSRIDSVRIAISKIGSPLPLAGEGSGVRALASDAFFPFRDSVDEAAKAGVTAIIQPGGSLKDQESIDAANEHKIAMVFTGVRHFRH